MSKAQHPAQTLNSALRARLVSMTQTQEAMEALVADPRETVRFSYTALDAIVGRVAPGRLLFVMANTGQGKTTFLLDQFDRWAQTGIGIDYLGTEQEPSELRQKWACIRCGVPAQVAINRAWGDWPQGEYWQEIVGEDLGKLDDAYGEQVLFHPDKFINLPKIEQAAEDAFQRKSRVLIVDHIDRVETHAHENEYLALKRIIRRLKELARDCRLVMVVASQVNRKGREGDRLAVYRPPQLQHMEGGGMKEHEADVVLGLWRPIRQTVSKEEMDRVRAGAAEPQTILEANTMAVVCLKHRTDGSKDGARCKLWVEHGRLSDLAEKDRYQSGLGGMRP